MFKKNYRKSAFSTLITIFKGLLIGSVDIVPGVSGGTIALMLSVYDKLIFELNNLLMAGKDMLRYGKLNFSDVDVRFLFNIFLGASLGIFLLSNLLLYLINLFPAFMYGLFISLVVVTSLVLFFSLSFSKIIILFSVGGVLLGHGVSYINFAANDSLLYLFVSAFTAVFALVLPGLSGAYILLVLGQYEGVLLLISEPFANLNALGVFMSGAITGGLVVVKLLGKFLNSHRNKIMAFMAGLMLGSISILLDFVRSFPGSFFAFNGFSLGILFAVFYFLYSSKLRSI